MIDVIEESQVLFARLEASAKENEEQENRRRAAEGRELRHNHYPYMCGALQSAYQNLYFAYKRAMDRAAELKEENERLKERLDNVREDDSAED
jgi:hypothetical protein